MRQPVKAEQQEEDAQAPRLRVFAGFIAGEMNYGAPMHAERHLGRQGEPVVMHLAVLAHAREQAHEPAMLLGEFGLIQTQQKDEIGEVTHVQGQVDEGAKDRAVLVVLGIDTEAIDGGELVGPPVDHRAQIVGFTLRSLAADLLAAAKGRAVRDVLVHLGLLLVQVARLPLLARLNGKSPHLGALLQQDDHELGQGEEDAALFCVGDVLEDDRLHTQILPLPLGDHGLHRGDLSHNAPDVVAGVSALWHLALNEGEHEEYGRNDHQDAGAQVLECHVVVEVCRHYPRRNAGEQALLEE